MRNAFIDELVQLARVNKNIALVVGDLGYKVVEPFADEFPDRFINAGVAEQNMTGLAAGMASEGFHVFTYSIANFPTFRCAEQIRNDIDYHNLPVTIVTVGGGLSWEEVKSRSIGMEADGYASFAASFGLIPQYMNIQQCLGLAKDVLAKFPLLQGSNSLHSALLYPQVGVCYQFHKIFPFY